MTNDQLFYAMLIVGVIGIIFSLVSWRMERGSGSIKSMLEL